MKKKYEATSIKDVAKEAGVSIATVSNALNNSRYVKEETKKRIDEIAKRLNYTPNVIARGLKTKSTNTVAIIVPDIANQFFAQVIRGAEEVAKLRKYNVLLICTYYDVLEEKTSAETLKKQFIDGVIFISGENSFDYIKELNDDNFPVVIADRELEDMKIPSVLVDNFHAMKKVVNYLYDLGHRKIGYISYRYNNQTTVRKRFEGYCDGLKENKLDYDPNIVVISETLRLNELEGSREVVRKILKSKSIPSVIMTASDLIAVGVIKALTELKVNIPEGMSVVGYDNILMSQYTSPLLTTVKQPKKKMGAAAMNLLLDIIEGKKIKSRNIILPTKLIKRQSVAKLAD
ncbi:MAG TPA: LacI family DNA-binding transcriptional regulator [Candidatus Paceibacterota bacterium]